MTFTVYTDGSCNNRQGKFGGFSAIVSSSGHKEIVIIGGELNSTSARMELAAVSASVQFARQFSSVDLNIFSDAEYIVKSFNEGWVWDWMKQGFPNTKNLDIWKQILRGIQDKAIKSFSITHVKGHSGVPLNEKADQWADKAAKEMFEISLRCKESTFERVVYT